ncbi:MAG: DnaJ domain-containing protein [Phycisphaerales bacterium]
MGSGSHHPKHREARHKVDGISCDAGEIVDLSRSGMRLRGKGKPLLRVGQRGRIALTFNGGVLNLVGHIVWQKRKGLRGWELGVTFIQLKPGLKKALEQISQFGFIPEEALENAASNTRRKKKAVRASLNMPDYYSVLGIDCDADDSQIQRAYRNLARKYHPDVAQDEASSRMFLRVTEAYETLKDAERRALFDLRSAM